MNIEKREITSELKESYLDYAMSVIVARALPDVRDGLKPVHRRVLWTMWSIGLTHLAKFRKSANVVGETMAKYHPHGDVAIYDTLARMAQDFSMRYPLVWGQGNFGSQDGDSPAAMRYTEARLSKVAEEMLFDIEKDTVDWQPNYDATRDEPKVLPAKVPNLLVNGTLGIAVGMATSIPPHNLVEVVDATLLLIEKPNAAAEDLLEYVKGPDFPTGGVIYDRAAVKAAYATGRGAVTTRAKAEIVERKKGESTRAGFDIVITEIPYQVNKSELVKHIAELVQEKRIEGIRDLRDESDREGLRIVVELKSDAAPQKILNQLYQHSDLQKDFHFNMIALRDGIQPELFSLKEMLLAYVAHRREVVKRRTQFDLKRAEERAHILEGLAKALDAIDKVIATIKKSKDREDARANLMKHFTLSEAQAAAILEMKLQTLAALERQKIEAELKEKRTLIKELTLILKSPTRMLEVVKKELMELKAKYGEARRTHVVAHALKEMTDEDLVPEEEAIITFSASGYVKRLPPDTFKAQRRGGKGLIGSDVAEEDFLSHFFHANTHDRILFFTGRGRVFETRAYEIPAASRTAKGKAIHNFLEIPADENISAIVNVPSSNKEPRTASPRGEQGARNKASETHHSSLIAHRYLVMVTKNGMIKKTALKDFENIRRTGIIGMKLSASARGGPASGGKGTSGSASGGKKGDMLKWVRLSKGDDQVVLVTEKGQSIRFAESQARPMGRGAAGVRAIRLRHGDAVAGFDVVKKSDTAELLAVMEKGFGKRTPLKEYKTQHRGGSGIRTAKVTEKTGKVVAGIVLGEETELLALSAKGQVIRTELKSVRQTGRSAQGVRIMNLNSGDRVAGVVVI
ncbi:MAG: DNA gyrase subunit A [Candidatus Liptonbacteria bacterium]|nr:DNA gyrase subunit A [Candidatus Liptonbacteria bacterium]